MAKQISSRPFQRPEGEALYCGAMSLEALAERFGTPLYVYAADQIAERLGMFQRAFKVREHVVCYAVKANSALAILKLLADRGAGFDIVSGGELERVLAAAPEATSRVVFSGVGKTAPEMDAGLKAGIMAFNVESEAELALLAERAQAEGQTRRDRVRDRCPALRRLREDHRHEPRRNRDLHPDISRRAYYNQPTWKRVVVILAGPAVNILIAFVLFAGILLVGNFNGAVVLSNLSGHSTTQITDKVAQVKHGTPAAAALRKGDRIVSVEGGRATPDGVRRSDQEAPLRGKQVQGCITSTPVHLTVERDGRTVALSDLPAVRHEGNTGADGVRIRRQADPRRPRRRDRRARSRRCGAP